MGDMQVILWHQNVVGSEPPTVLVHLACGHEREVLRQDLELRLRNRWLWLLCRRCALEQVRALERLWLSAVDELPGPPPIPNPAAVEAAGLDPERVRFGWWLVASGRVSDRISDRTR